MLREKGKWSCSVLGQTRAVVSLRVRVIDTLRTASSHRPIVFSRHYPMVGVKV
jgi:hypothetical protein